ncbi:MAG: glycosyltransferase [Pirellulaceae bacterium]
MKVLLCHNHYRVPGGEDQVFADEARLLESSGLGVVRYVRHSDETEEMSSLETLRHAFWSQRAYDELREIIRAETPDVMHCTNTFPLISPAAYDAARDEGIPVVQSLHNFRFLCLNGLLMRKNSACEDCLGKAVAWPGVLRGCYRNRRLASAAMAGLIARQRRRRLQDDPITLYVALSEFSKRRFIKAGFPAERLVVKPNFVDPDPGPGTGDGEYALFVGRLSEEKGLDLLIDAWSRSTKMPPLKIVGDGPLSQPVRQAESENQRVAWLGRRSIDDIYALLQKATCLILPSQCYENCPKTILEAYSCGTPVVASDLGSLREYVEDGITGRLFQPSNAGELAQAVQSFYCSTEHPWRMRHAARRAYEAHFTADVNFRMLTRIYAQALGGPMDALVPALAEGPDPSPQLPVLGNVDREKQAILARGEPR